MELTFKAKVKSLDFLLKNRNKGCGVNIDMLALAGKEVTITNFDPSDDYMDVKEDRDGSEWQAWMFEGMPNLPKETTCAVSKPLQGSKSIRIGINGCVKVGCQTVEAADVEKLFKASQAQAAAFKKAIEGLKKPKAKKKASKK